MRHYLKIAGVFYGSIALVPFVGGLASALPGLASPAFFLLVFGLLAALLALAIGLVVFLIHGVRCAKQLSDPLHRVTVVLAGPVMTIAVLRRCCHSSRSGTMLEISRTGSATGRRSSRVRPSPCCPRPPDPWGDRRAWV